MESVISKAIIERYFNKLLFNLKIDCAIVGSGPSGLVCAYALAKAGRKVAIFEKRLRPGGGITGGAMLFNEIIFPDSLSDFLSEMGIRYKAIDGNSELLSSDSIEVASALTYRAVNAGANIFNGISVEDLIYKNGKVSGIVINWTEVLENGLHVDPLMIEAKTVLDAGGHHAELTAKFAKKAGIKLNTETGSIMGEKPMWAEEGEKATVENTAEVFPGLFVSGMAANGVYGSFRMGPIFGGMIYSGLKASELILSSLEQQ
ncbi:MAG TPA: sulfide-dependent adenosine diphosphate thiazole synthase [Victivallales bacterium]|nr:sulfide-dependent adenosine diphosphate thiazole synthase [Victivallales bacterium]